MLKKLQIQQIHKRECVGETTSGECRDSRNIKEAELEALKDKYLRTVAVHDNYKKHSKRGAELS